jgi:cytochrome c-550 PedF
MKRNDIRRGTLALVVVAIAAGLAPAAARPHGDVNPQPVDTKGLKPLGDAWLANNPYRGDKAAIAIGKTAYNQQCARCHGIEGVSGGLAPDLRGFEKGDGGDKDFVSILRKGVFRDGRTLMPKYDGILSQEAIWALRAWVEAVHED